MRTGQLQGINNRIKMIKRMVSWSMATGTANSFYGDQERLPSNPLITKKSHLSSWLRWLIFLGSEFNRS